MHLKRIDDTAAVAVLFEKKLYGSRLPSEVMDSVGADAFNCSAAELNKTRFTNIKSNKIPVNIYTVNDRKKYEEIFGYGCKRNFYQQTGSPEKSFELRNKRGVKTADNEYIRRSG